MKEASLTYLHVPRTPEEWYKDTLEGHDISIQQTFSSLELLPAAPIAYHASSLVVKW